MILSAQDIELIVSTINVPLMAFGSDKFAKEIGSDKVQTIRYKLKQMVDENKIDDNDVDFILSAFIIARDIISKNEYHTITGSDWRESIRIVEKMSVKDSQRF